MKRKIFATYTGWIILVNVIFFIVMLALFPLQTEIIDGQQVLVSNPFVKENIAINWGNILAGKIWTFITSMFAHANLTHLFVNMLSLMFIGSFVERLIGKKRFLIFYFIAGLFAGLLFVLLAGLFGNSDLGARIFGSPLAYAVGASGAIFGLGGLLAILTPKLRVLVFFIIPMPMWGAMVALMGIFWILSISANLPIGNTAHLGGLLVGVGYGLYLRHRYPRKTKMIAKYFSR